MVLYIAGVNHFDPMCRGKLSQWLKNLSNSNKGLPCFLAAEWSEDYFLKVKSQRKNFRQILQKEWPHLSSEALDVLELSLGYEADTHIKIFPDVELLWLDKGRWINPDSIKKYAKKRLTVLKSCLQNDILPKDSLKALEKISKSIRQREKPFSFGNGRDKKYARLIIKRIEKCRSDWAIVIVGEYHASEDRQSMRSILENQGLTCKVTFL